MAGDFFPRKDGAFVAWSACLRRHIVLAPAQFGLSESDVLWYAALDDELAEAYAASSDAALCSRVDTARKNQARLAVEEAVRKIAAQVKGLAGSGVVAPASVIALGLNPRGRGGRHAAIAAPIIGPNVVIRSAFRRIIDVRITDKLRLYSRARPRGAKGAHVWTLAAPEQTADVNAWRYFGIVVKPTVKITFPEHLPPGTHVWVMARWFTATGQLSPESTVADTYLPGDSVLATVPRKSA